MIFCNFDFHEEMCRYNNRTMESACLYRAYGHNVFRKFRLTYVTLRGILIVLHMSTYMEGKEYERRHYIE